LNRVVVSMETSIVNTNISNTKSQSPQIGSYFIIENSTIENVK